MFIQRLFQQVEDVKKTFIGMVDENKFADYDWTPDEDDEESEIQLCEALENVIPFRRSA